MVGNIVLNKLKTAKNNDEFYTTHETIEKELVYYSKQLENKVILCNCDDPFESNFSKYFIKNFNKLKLKKLICTSYKSSKIKGKNNKKHLKRCFLSNGARYCALIGLNFMRILRN